MSADGSGRDRDRDRDSGPMTPAETMKLYGVEAQFVGFCGAGGVGKTTTAKAVCEGTGFSMLASASRGVFQRHGVATEDDQNNVTPEDRWVLQSDIQEAHWRQQFRTAIQISSQPSTRIICDRTQWDQFAYALHQCAQVIDEERYQWLRNLSLASTRFYTHIFYFPFITYSKDALNDGMRTTNWGMRLKFDMLLQQLLTSHRIPFIQVQGNTVEERASFIANVANLKSSDPT